MVANCPLFNSSETRLYETAIVNIRVVVSSISFFGSLFVIALIWLFKKYKFFTQRLILYLSLSAFISSIAYSLGRVSYDPNKPNLVKFCEFQGSFLLYTDWTVLLSIVCITINLLITVSTEMCTKKLEAIFFAVIFLLPLPICCIPFYHESFGPSGAWCWIRDKTDNCTAFKIGRYLQFSVWYIPQYTIIPLLYIMYIIIVIRTKRKIRTWQGTYDPSVEYKKTLMKKEIKSLLWYPTVYFLVTFFPLINRITTEIIDTPIFALYILHVLTSPLQGALIALAYALDKDTLQRLNWRSIKGSLKYRNTDNLVKEYPVESCNDEEGHPFVNETNYHSISSSQTQSPSRKNV